jgi:tetratricopeptide (TPR) repeat protein
MRGKRLLALALTVAAAAASPVQAGWRQASTAHFVIYSEGSEKSLHDFASRLERYDAAMRHLRGLSDPPISPANRLTVFVVTNETEIRKLYGKGGAMVGGFYIGRVDGSYAFTPLRSEGSHTLSEQIVLLHEYAHHFMYQHVVGAIPAWFSEGFAEFHSTARFEKDGSVGLGLPANHRAYGLLGMRPIKLEKLFTSATGDLTAAEIDSFYGRGWLLTHYLSLDPTRKGQLGEYLGLINKGIESLAAARKVFGDLDQLDKELNAYVRRRSLSYLKLAPAATAIKPITVRALTPAESAVMEVRIRSKRGVDEAGARALLPLARKAAAPYPNDVFAQVTLAEAALDAGELAEAEAAADRAIAADPKAVEALIFKGRIKMAQAVEAEARDAPTWREVRKWFLAANKIEPDDPEPLALFYTSFLAAGAQPTANAALGLQQALALAPQDGSLRWMMAFQHLRDNKAEEARQALAPIAFDPHGGEQAKAAARILDKLASGGVKAALEAWEEPKEEKPAA